MISKTSRQMIKKHFSKLINFDEITKGQSKWLKRYISLLELWPAWQQVKLFALDMYQTKQIAKCTIFKTNLGFIFIIVFYSYYFHYVIKMTHIIWNWILKQKITSHGEPLWFMELRVCMYTYPLSTPTNAV
jgi:hypothetical protein